MAAEASHLNVTLVVAIFAVTHRSAVVGSAPQTGDGMTPDVAAVAADAVLFVNPFFVRCAKRAVAIGAGQSRALHVNRVREPYVCRLARIDQPWRGGLWFQVNVDKFCFGGRRTKFVGVASGAGVVLRDSGERAVTVERVARIAIGVPGFFRVHLVQEINRLRLMRIKNPGKNDPTSDQGNNNSKGEDE